MDILLLRFDAPLMSFGGVQVDEQGPTRPWPGRSMLTGLLGNALGYDHSEWQRLQRLQDRLRYGVRLDRPGQVMTDYQTVDLGQAFMRSGWTTRGEPEGRKGGRARVGTHIRYRRYLAGAAVTVALTLEPGDKSEPTISSVEAALMRPKRPLFIGRKPFIPSEPLLLGREDAPSLLSALRTAPVAAWLGTAGSTGPRWMTVLLPADDAPTASRGEVIPAVDGRDWRNQVHEGRRLLWRGRIGIGGGGDPAS